MRIRGLRRHTTVPDQGATEPTPDESEVAELAHAARDYLFNYGWSTARGPQSLRLVLDDELVALLVPASAAPQLDALLLAADIASPVIDIPGTGWAFLSGHNHATAPTVPAGTTLLTGADVPLPPTRTAAGQVRWARHPDDATIEPIADILRVIDRRHDRADRTSRQPVAIGSLMESGRSRSRA
jgi:hypothetical protein